MNNVLSREICLNHYVYFKYLGFSKDPIFI